MNKLQIIVRGIVKENPTFVLLLGMCPTLATTTSALNGMSMGLATMAVLILSNMTISAIARFIPDKVRIPSYIVVIATFVTLLQLLMQAYVPDIYATLGLFIPLIVVNCIILGRAEAFANKNGVVDSALDGVGIGLGCGARTAGRRQSFRLADYSFRLQHPGFRAGSRCFHRAGLPDRGL